MLESEIESEPDEPTTLLPLAENIPRAPEIAENRDGHLKVGLRLEGGWRACVAMLGGDRLDRILGEAMEGNWMRTQVPFPGWLSSSMEPP